MTWVGAGRPDRYERQLNYIFDTVCRAIVEDGAAADDPVRVVISYDDFQDYHVVHFQVGVRSHQYYVAHQNHDFQDAIRYFNRHQIQTLAQDAFLRNYERYHIVRRALSAAFCDTGYVAARRYQRQQLYEAREQYYNLRDAEQREQNNKANERAKETLLELLSPSQRKTFTKDGHFEVIGNHSGKRYKITPSSSSNIYELDKSGKQIKTWCFVSGRSIPLYDQMLMQKFSLETDEQATMEVAILQWDIQHIATCSSFADTGMIGWHIR